MLGLHKHTILQKNACVNWKLEEAFNCSCAILMTNLLFQRVQGTKLQRLNYVIITWIPERDGATSNPQPKDWMEPIQICKITNKMYLNDSQLCMLQYTKILSEHFFNNIFS